MTFGTFLPLCRPQFLPPLRKKSRQHLSSFFSIPSNLIVHGLQGFIVFSWPVLFILYTCFSVCRETVPGLMWNWTPECRTALSLSHRHPGGLSLLVRQVPGLWVAIPLSFDTTACFTKFPPHGIWQHDAPREKSCQEGPWVFGIGLEGGALLAYDSGYKGMLASWALSVSLLRNWK